MFKNNPLLFFNYPQNLMPMKKKILKFADFTIEMGLQIFRKYPSILIWSVRSLEEKVLFLKNRLDIAIDINTM